MNESGCDVAIDKSANTRFKHLSFAIVVCLSVVQAVVTCNDAPE